MNNFTRKALIISSWSQKDSREFRSGVREDVAKIKGFLQSGHGGCFIDGEEIVHLHRPKRAAMRCAMDWLSASDYAFLYYSGHGMSVRGEAQIALSAGLSGRVMALANLAPRQITIVDTCRNEIATYESFTGIGDPMGDIERVPWEFSRRAFAEMMSSQPVGRVLIQSSGYDQSSYSMENGGIFTNALMGAVEEFKDNEVYGRLTTQSAFRMARRGMARIALHQQQPELRCSPSLNGNGLMLAIQPEVVYQRWLERVG